MSDIHLRKVVAKIDSPDSALIEQKLKENGGYCPCKLEKSEDTKCMCKEFRETIQKVTPLLNVCVPCHCGLYCLVGVSDGQS